MSLALYVDREPSEARRPRSDLSQAQRVRYTIDTVSSNSSQTNMIDQS